MAEIVVEEGWRDRLERWSGLRKDSVVLLVVVGVVAAVALLLWHRNPPAQIAPPSQPVEAPLLRGDSAVPGAAEASPTAVVLVHVSGAVARPGLYELPLGARVADAIDLAKGPRPAADLDSLNLAEPLADGQKVDVPRRGEAVAAVPPPTAAAPGAPTGTTIDLNTADQAALETIPGVGPVTASAILAYRDEIGGFDSIDQLLEVTGIGPATLESMRAYVSV